MADWFGGTLFWHTLRYNTPCKLHTKLCTFSYKFGAQVHRPMCSTFCIDTFGLVREHPLPTSPTPQHPPTSHTPRHVALHTNLVRRYIALYINLEQLREILYRCFCIEHLIVTLSMDPTALPTFQNLPAYLREPFLHAVRRNPLQWLLPPYTDDEFDSSEQCLARLQVYIH